MTNNPFEQQAKAKERGKAKAEAKACDGAQVLPSPLQHLGNQTVGTLSQSLDKNILTTPNCPYLGPRQCIQQWQQLGADKVLIQGIMKGVRAPLHSVPPPLPAGRDKSHPFGEQMTKTIGEYLANGIIRPLTATESQNTRHWVPTFPRPKKDSDKIRIITDLRQLNNCHQVPKHKQETWNSMLNTLQDPTLQWAITLDLKSFFHHLQLHPKMQRWMRIQVDNHQYQLQGMPFGWALSPWWSNKLSKPIRQWMNQRQWAHAWYVDDILLLAHTKAEAEHRAAQLIQLLTQLGVQVNKEKSMTQAAQTVLYLGHYIDLNRNKIHHTTPKLTQAVKMVKHQLTGKNFQPKNAASLAGTLVDLSKSILNIQGLPQQLMQMAAKGVRQNKPYCKHYKQAWQYSTSKPPQMQKVLQTTLQELLQPIAKVMRPAAAAQQYTLQTDSSNQGWGACLLLNNKEIGTCAQQWQPQEKNMHITQTEALASALALHNLLPKVTPGSSIKLQSDAISTVYAWNKGSKNNNINHPILQSLKQATMRDIHIRAEHIPGHLNVRADWLSRNTDPKNYHLNRDTFHKVCKHFNHYPELDLFANRGNRQVKRFCSWRDDCLSQGNAFNNHWGHQINWLNPPWELITKCINKVKQDRARVLFCLPYWQTATWWRDLLPLLTRPLLIVKGRPLYQNPQGDHLPPPRWATCFGIAQG